MSSDKGFKNLQANSEQEVTLEHKAFTSALTAAAARTGGKGAERSTPRQIGRSSNSEDLAMG